MLTILDGARSGRSTADAATGSGGETIAARANAAGQVNAGVIACTATATTPIVTSTRRTPSRTIGQSSLRKSRTEPRNAVP